MQIVDQADYTVIVDIFVHPSWPFGALYSGPFGGPFFVWREGGGGSLVSYPGPK